MSLSFKDKATGKENAKPCFTFKLPDHYFSEDHDIYMFMSASSGQNIPNQHVIHNVRFWDTLHLHDSEGQDTAEELREFHGKANDIMRQRLISSDRKYTMDSYNAQLIRHNKLYSKVVSEFITNSEMMLHHLHHLPHQDVMSTMSEEAAQISSRFSLMMQQFDTYQSDVKKYQDYLEKVVKNRDDLRAEGNPNNPANSEQKDIIDSVTAVQAVV